MMETRDQEPMKHLFLSEECGSANTHAGILPFGEGDHPGLQN